MDELKDNIMSSVKGMNEKAVVINKLIEENNILKTKLTENSGLIDQLQLDHGKSVADIGKERDALCEQTNNYATQLEELGKRDQNNMTLIASLRQEIESYALKINEKPSKLVHYKMR